MPRMWQVTGPNGEQILLSEGRARHWAKRASRIIEGRWEARSPGSERTVASSHQYLYVYEGGRLVEKGNILGSLTAMAKELVD